MSNEPLAPGTLVLIVKGRGNLPEGKVQRIVDDYIADTGHRYFRFSYDKDGDGWDYDRFEVVGHPSEGWVVHNIPKRLFTRRVVLEKIEKIEKIDPTATVDVVFRCGERARGMATTLRWDEGSKSKIALEYTVAAYRVVTNTSPYRDESITDPRDPRLTLYDLEQRIRQIAERFGCPPGINKLRFIEGRLARAERDKARVE